MCNHLSVHVVNVLCNKLLCHFTNPATTKVTNIRQCSQNSEIIHAYLLQRYASLRTNKQEAFYNLGRAAHQLNLTHLAVPWYQQALSAEPAKAFTTLGDTLAEDRESHTDLTRVIAYNLAQIYIASGSEALARKVMRDHLTVWVAFLAKLDGKMLQSVLVMCKMDRRLGTS